MSLLVFFFSEGCSSSSDEDWDLGVGATFGMVYLYEYEYEYEYEYYDIARAVLEWNGMGWNLSYLSKVVSCRSLI